MKYYRGNRVQEILDNQGVSNRPRKPTLTDILIGTAITIGFSAIIGLGLLYSIDKQVEINQQKDQQYQQLYPETYKELMNK